MSSSEWSLLQLISWGDLLTEAQWPMTGSVPLQVCPAALFTRRDGAIAHRLPLLPHRRLWSNCLATFHSESPFNVIAFPAKLGSVEVAAAVREVSLSFTFCGYFTNCLKLSRKKLDEIYLLGGNLFADVLGCSFITNFVADAVTMFAESCRRWLATKHQRLWWRRWWLVVTTAQKVVIRLWWHKGRPLTATANDHKTWHTSLCTSGHLTVPVI